MDGAGRSAGVSCPIPKGEVIRAWVFFFFKIFLHIFTILLCVYIDDHIGNRYL